MRVAIIGSGNIAHVQAPLILKHRDVQLVGIADEKLESAKALGNELNVPHVYQDAHAMIREQKPDVVHVLVPPHYHADLSVMAMNEGCHVLVEKPMALTVAECEKMIEAVCEFDDDMMEKYLDGKTDFPVEQIKKAIRKGVLATKLFPVLAASSYKNKGVQSMLDAVCDYLPCPTDLPPVKGMNPDTGK